MALLETLHFFFKVIIPIQVKMLLILITKGRGAAGDYRRQQFALMVNEFSVDHNEKTKDIKAKLFQQLHRLQSKDPDLRAEGKIRILEIGIGGGANLQFYPPNCNLIAVDYNTAFEKIVRDKLKTYPEMSLDFQIGSAADMASIPNNSVDVVISTIVLCSISDLKGVLKEVHRVLVPGGRYCYMEHILEEPGTLLNVVQTVLDKSGIWPAFSDGCHFKPLDKILAENSPFSSIDQSIARIDTSGFLSWWFVRSHLSGVQIKEFN